MDDARTGSEKAFSRLASSLGTDPGSGAPRRKGFGQRALWAGTKMFAFLDRSGALVLKLPAERVAELVAAGTGQPWDPGHGRLQREWFAVRIDQRARWLPLARESQRYVAGRTAERASHRRAALGVSDRPAVPDD